MTVGISTLPIELRIHILHQLWDISDLSAAIASDESLAEAFANCSSSTLVANILRNEIDSRLWPLAIIIWQIRTSRKQYVIVDGRDAWNVLQDCHAYDTNSAWEELCRVDLSEAREHFHDLHQTVQHFTTDFLSQAVRYLSIGDGGELPTPTASEVYRVQRSFYYFELCCLIWGNGERVRADWDMNISWGLAIELSPWMNEQVASVYEYLLRQLSTAFGEMATHEVECGPGTNTLLPTPSPTDRDEDFWVSWGLQYLFKIIGCSNDEDRNCVLQEKRSSRGWLPLRSALEDLNWGYYKRYPLENPGYMQQEQEMDEDNSGPGPGLLWCSAHSTDNGNQFVLGPDYAALREAGYVMWDAERKSQLDQFRQSKNLP